MKVDQSFLDTLGHFRNYLGGQAAAKALSFISIPVFTRILSPEDYGNINLILSYIAIFVILFPMNFQSSISRYYYEERDDFSNFFTTSVLASSFLVVLNSALVYFLFEYLETIITLPRSIIIFLFPLVLYALFRNIFTQVLAPQLKSGLLAKVNIIYAYGTFAISVILVLLLDKDKYLGIVYSSLLVGFLFFAYYIYNLRSYFKLGIKKEHLQYVLNFSIPLIPYHLSGVILAQIDRIMISNYSGYSDTGLYSFAYNIGMLLIIISTSINTAWTPKYFKFMNAKNYREHDKDLNYIVSIVFFIGTGLILFSKELGLLLAAEEFHGSLQIIPLIVLGYVFQFMYTIYGRNFTYTKKTIYSTVIYLTAGVANIVLNAITIPRIGYKSAALNTTVSFFLLFVLAYIANVYLLKIRYYGLKNLIIKLMLVLMALMVTILLDYYPIDELLQFLLKIPVFFILAFLLFKSTQKIDHKLIL